MRIGVITAAIGVALLTGCGSGSSGSSAPTTDWIGTWNANVMKGKPADAAGYRPIAKRLCKGLKAGTITQSDLYNMPQVSDDGMTPAQMLTFEFAAVKQYCPDQMSKMPVDDAPTG